ncbi:MAG: hypothetical protein J7K96_02750 [Desulfobacteraceae bacterium]|nr:hypothetical protein [Desulfobacteraceae bacterium]
MVEAWFGPEFAWIPGTLLGTIGGGIGGPLAGIFAPRGKFKKQVLGFYYTILVISAVMFIAGVAALLSGQPYGVWYALGFPGLLCLILFGVLQGVVSKRYEEAELRKTMAKDL